MNLGDQLQQNLESTLATRRQRKILARARTKSAFREWLEVIITVYAVLFVLNTYITQAYQIPSPSMYPELQVSDRLFVDKFTFGPEILPGFGRFPAAGAVHRYDVLAFENPANSADSDWFRFLRRSILILSFGLFDIDRLQTDEYQSDLLVKRAVGMPGDRLRYMQHSMYLYDPIDMTWRSADALLLDSGIDVQLRRIATESSYSDINHYAVLRAQTQSAGSNMVFAGTHEADVEQALTLVQANILRDSTGLILEAYDPVYLTASLNMAQLAVDPSNAELQNAVMAHNLGWYMNENSYFMLGDNRDDSADSRFFGPVDSQNILARAGFRFWPLHRIGVVN